MPGPRGAQVARGPRARPAPIESYGRLSDTVGGARAEAVCLYYRLGRSLLAV